MPDEYTIVINSNEKDYSSNWLRFIDYALQVICNIIIYRKHNNFKHMAFPLASVHPNFLQEQCETYSITISTLFPNEIDNHDQVELFDVFQSTTLQQHMHLLKRYHLETAHLPEIKLLGDFHKNIEITMRVYATTLLDQIKRYTHQEKLDYSIQLLQTYQALVKQYGYFLITHNHIRVDDCNNLALWINDDFKLNFPSHSIETLTQNPELYAVGQLIKIIKEFFTTDFFKYRKIQSFNQLTSYLEFIKKRNQMHKKCRTKAREQSETKRRTTLSVKNLRYNDTPQKRHDRLLRPICSFSTLLASNILSRGSREKYPSQSFLNSSSVSRIEVSKGSSDSKKLKSQVDTTIVSSELKNTRNISYLQLSNIIQKSQKKSCVFGSNPEVIPQNTIKHSSVMTRKCTSKRLNTHFCPIQYKRKAERKKEAVVQSKKRESSLEKKNTLQIGLNNLLLSQINEDPENETGGSDLKRRQHLLEEFETLLCN